MNDLVAKITDWPVVVQGAAGSALFWLILLVATKITDRSLQATVSFGKKKRLEVLYAEHLLLSATSTGDKADRTMAVAALLYGALHYALKGLAALALSLMLGDLVPVLKAVGTAFSAYYFLWALTIVRDIPSNDEKIASRLERVEQLIEKLDPSANDTPPSPQRKPR